MPPSRLRGFVAATAAIALTAGAPTPDGATLLRQAVTAHGRQSYIGEVQNTAFGTDRSTAVLFRIEHRAPDLTRRWYLAPGSMYGDSIVSRGDTNYNLDARQKRIVVVHDDAMDDQVALDDNLRLLFDNYRAVVGPNVMVAGRSARNVLLINRYTGQTVMRVALDAATGLVLEKSEFSGSGSVTHEMRFESIRFTGDIPAKLFDVPSSGYHWVMGRGHGKLSANLQEVVARAGFSARGPRYLPEGFVPITGDVSTIKGVRNLHLLYSDGLRTLSLFENARGAAVDPQHYTRDTVTIGTHTGEYMMDGPTALVAWSAGPLHFALVGELSRAEMLRIAESVSP